MDENRPVETSRTKPAEVERAGVAWRMTAWVAGIFMLLVGVTMTFSELRIRSDDPLKSATLKLYKDKLRASPADEKLKSDIRQLDLELRTRYFRHLARKQSGAYLLLCGAAVLVLAVVRLEALRRQPPAPGPKLDALPQAIRIDRLSRWLVAGSGAAIGVFLLVCSLSLTTALPQRTAEIEKLLGTEAAEPMASDSASVEELKQNWPRFRGPEGNGNFYFTNVPAKWDAQTGDGIAWKTAAPAAGYSSPILWGSRIFFSGVTESARTVYGLDASTGRMLWHESVPTAAGASPSLPEGASASSYAAATMATDGRRAYAIFGNGDLVAFTLEGKLAWKKVLGPLKNAYGHAASLTTWREKLLLQLDQGEPDQGKSKLYAFDGRNGQLLWQRPRKVGSSWASPLVIETAGKAQIITLAVPWVIAYAAADGAELWRMDGLNGEITPSPCFAAGLVFAASPSEKLFAIRPDGSGDVSKTHVVWTTEENVPDITSPASDGELVFTLTTSGVLSCFDAKDGKKQWEHDFAVEFHASPSVGAKRVYLFSLKGTAIVVEAARQFKEVFRTELGDVFDASPAFAENRIYLRGETNIWCLGPSSEKLTKTH